MEKTYYARGKRGLAYIAEVDGRKVLIKEPNPAARVNTIAHEEEMLRLVNAIGVGPRLIWRQEDSLVMEFIEGEKIMDWAAHASPQALAGVVRALLEQCRRLDLAGINKAEMNHPEKHVLVRDGSPVQIDFDRARRMRRPKNVTQLCQWLANSAFAQLLRRNGLAADPQAILDAAQRYKSGYDAAAFDAVLAAAVSRPR